MIFEIVTTIETSQVLLVVKNPPDKGGDIRDGASIPVLGRSPGGGHGNPLQYSCLENPHNRGACASTIHGLAMSWTQLRDLKKCRNKKLNKNKDK